MDWQIRPHWGLPCKRSDSIGRQSLPLRNPAISISWAKWTTLATGGAAGPWKSLRLSSFWALGLDLEVETVAKKAVQVAAGLARADAWETGLIVGEEKTVNSLARDDRGDAAFQSRRVKEMHGQAALLRDIFGNPFRPVTADTSWLTPTMSKLAQDTPDLADALEDAGCMIREILDHCRGPGPHVRGCWVVDLVLGKS